MLVENNVAQSGRQPSAIRPGGRRATQASSTPAKIVVALVFTGVRLFNLWSPEFRGKVSLEQMNTSYEDYKRQTEELNKQ
jgi:hypothetical protein